VHKPRIVVVGSLNMDIVVSMERLPKIGETVSGEVVHYIPGGKGANQALGCGRLMADTTLIGCVGVDGFADTIRKQLAGNQVRVDTIEAVDRSVTGTALISHTSEDNCIVVVPGANAACTGTYVRKFGERLRSADVVVAQLEIPLEAVYAAFSVSKSAGVITVLNPAPAKSLPKELIRVTDYLTPNETEWELIVGKFSQDDAMLLQTIDDWERRYATKVVVTRGDKGCSFVEEGRLVTIPAPRVRVVDTTGAGDAFNAAFAYGLAMRKPLHEIAKFAVIAASLSVQKFGAQSGMPTLEEVMQV
jgi:ribokinase